MNDYRGRTHVSKYDRIPRGIARYGVAEWDRAMGNHRAVIRVSEPGEAAYAYLPWRRRDAFPQAKHVRIVDAQTGRTVANSVVVSCNREYGEVVFEPVSGPGLYYAYYLVPGNDPNRWRWPRNAFPITLYEPAHSLASDAWREKHRVRLEDITSPPNLPGPWIRPDPYPAPWRDLPEAELVEFQSRGQWHSFYPMEIIATLEERQDLVQRTGGRPFLLFPESRYRPIRMTRDIPYNWAVRRLEQLDSFKETALRNEYLVFQVGVYAHRQLLPNLKVAWSGLSGPDGVCLPASAITCFNVEGLDHKGRPFSKTIHVPQGHVQALWFGIDIPRDAAPGRYEGTISISAQDAAPQTVRLQIAIKRGIIQDRGDGDGTRLSRLRWLNSRHALDDEVCAPFTPVEVRSRSVRILGRTVDLDESGLPVRLTSFIDMFRIRDSGRSVLAAPVRFDALLDGKPVIWKTSVAARCRRKSSGKAQFRSVQTAQGISRETDVTIEMDGRIGVSIALTSRKKLTLDGLRLALQLPADISRYWLESVPACWEAAGLGRLGSVCPVKTGMPLRDFQFAWIGDYNAGLAISIAGSQPGWLRGKNGRFDQKISGRTCSVVLDTGRLVLEPDSPATFAFALYLTPFKPLALEHWRWRYCQEAYGRDLNLEQGIEAGAMILTQHQGSLKSPYISYLFPSVATLRKMADRIHQVGGRFKAYNTVRELSTRANELWALRSLGTEILTESWANMGFESLAQLPLEYQLRNIVNEPFTGQLWMCEHLVDDYHSRWHSPIAGADGKMITEDSSVQVSGASRWSNFYIESQRWLMENAGVDGLYLDGTTFDRDSFVRVRKTLVRQKPEALIDVHGSPAEVMDFLGFVDSIWFGEGADYGREDAYWLTAVSGIPFGVPGELLLTEASVQRGMVYGLSQRYAWMPIKQVNPSALWKWWDDFDIRNAEMLGYWMQQCPVKTSHPAVKATAYVHKGRCLAIALASWAPEPVTVALTIDWNAVGLDPAAVTARMPELHLFQPGANHPLNAIPVDPDKGWIIEIG